MRLLGPAIGGLIGGAIGAAIWAAIAYFTHFELGWIAWGIGALVGFGALTGTSDEGSVYGGLLAMVISIVSIAAGKYAAVSMIVNDALGEMKVGMAEVKLSDEQCVAWMADDLAKEAEDAGKKLDWPAGMSLGEAGEEKDYPPKVWADAKGRWGALSAADKESYRTSYQDQMRAHLSEITTDMAGMAVNESFWGSFGVFDLLFGVLAVGTAFKIATGNRE